MKMKSILLVAMVCVSARGVVAAPPVISESRVHVDTVSGLSVVAGKVLLPANGWWYAEPLADAGAVTQVYLQPGEEAIQRMQGTRSREADRQQQIERGRYALQSLLYPCQQYAMKHQGAGPSQWSEVRPQSNWLAQTEGYFLVPNTTYTNDPRRPRVAKTDAWIVELKPAVDDGKYWIAFADGRVERVAIDAALVTKYGLSIQPKEKAGDEPAHGDAVAYSIYALRKTSAKSPAKIMLTNSTAGTSFALAWNPDDAQQVPEDLVATWRQERAQNWAGRLMYGHSPALENWTQASPHARAMAEARGGRRGDAMSVLSGRAAVRETLQMQAARGGRVVESNSIPLREIPGVAVESHPFEKMLEGKAGGRLPLAECVPADRFFLYCAQPKSLLPLLGQGSDFAFRMGSAALENNIRYDLKARYLEQLGLSEDWLQRLVKLGAVKEVGLVLSDLFLVDGADITAVARVPAIKMLAPLLELAGVPELSDKISEAKNPRGATAFWTLQGDLLVVSSSRSEVEQIIALTKNDGAGSLGRSAEYRYMLTQLPVQDATRIHAYFSDSFIRRLVGPQIKIAQTRRLNARADLERIAAAGLLWKLDGQGGAPDLPALVAKNYVPKEMLDHDYALTPEGVAVSKAFGSPGHMQPLSAQNVDSVTPSEAAAYRQYVEDYSRFWRQYFDPIAIRLDDDKDGGLTMTTFILPLVNNSIYDGLRTFINASKSGAKLNVPHLDPSPIALLSLNLKEEEWVKMTRNMIESWSQTLGLPPTIFDQFGPSFHLAIQDGDPIVTFGSGDLEGLFGGMEMAGGRSSEMMFIPILASILTRPCDLFIEVKDPAIVRAALENLPSVSSPGSRRGTPQMQSYRLAGRDAWITVLDIEGFVKLRFGLEIMDHYLVIRNLPWSPHVRVAGSDVAPLNGIQLDVFPEAGKQQQAGLFTTFAERERAANLSGMNCLWPLLITGCATPADAQKKHAALFGFTPEHPGSGEWKWSDGEIRSTTFGGFYDSCQPEYKPGDRPFGIFQGIENLRLNLQFEDTGLRVITHWKTSDPQKR